MICLRRMVFVVAVSLFVAGVASKASQHVINRHFIRFRSYPPEPTAADLREVFQLLNQGGNNLFRYLQPLTLTSDDLDSILKPDEDQDASSDPMSFLRLGPDDN